MPRRWNSNGWVFLVAVLVSGGLVASNVAATFAASNAVSQRAEFFKPDCSSRDSLCRAWTEYRRAHPYPCQSLAVKSLNRGRELVIVISEPSPLRSKAELRSLVKTTFGEDLRALRTLRWNIGIDGWVEDLVLKVRWSPKVSSRKKGAKIDPLDDPLLRDRIALLHLALFGTAYGGRLEPIGASSGRKDRTGAPNLHVNAKELHDWMMDPGTEWRPIGTEDAPAAAWSSMAARKVTGAFASQDGALVMLTFPAEHISAALQEPKHRKRLRAAFRRFTIASDAILGGVWTQDGQAAIVARFREKPLAALPPLRFETFALLATQWSDELHQSYERSNAVAGKLITGKYKYRDWAPIYLSEPLIDTEFGALLNITDQMLKSWSEAGSVEYIYFAYPLKPGRFPFGGKPLSRILKEETGSLSVLYNWNTAGSAVVAKFPDLSVLVARQTGSLPVTYGSELKPGEAIETGHLMKYEDRAYDYFAGITDPNLERVVQYTLLYQLFRAINADLGGGVPASGANRPRPDFVIEARSDSSGFLVEETARLLKALNSGRTRPVIRNLSRDALNRVERDIHEKLLPRIDAFRRRHPEMNLKQLSTLLADPSSVRGNVERAVAQFRSRQAAYNQLVGDFNQLSKTLHTQVNQWLRTDPGALPASVTTLEEAVPYLPKILRDRGERLRAMSADLRRRKSALENAQINGLIEEHKQIMHDVGEINRPLRSVAWAVCDFDAVRRRYIELNAEKPDGWIKTPSAVLSWNRESISFEGGHNLRARALRLEPVEGVKDIELKETRHGLVLRFNPAKAGAVAAKAGDLARAVEHGQVRSTEELKKIVASARAKERTRFAALEIPEQRRTARSVAKLPGVDAWRGRLGARIYTEKNSFVEGFRKLAEDIDCCELVVRNGDQSSYVTQQNPSLPSSSRILEVGDTPSLIAHLSGATAKKKARPLVFLGQTPEHVTSLMTGIVPKTRTGDRLMSLARLLGKRSVREPFIGSGITLVHKDFDGKPSYLCVGGDSANLKEASHIREILDRLTSSISKESWAGARISLLQREDARAMARNADWSTSRDGVPAGVSVSLDTSSGGIPRLKLYAIAGFDRGKSSVGSENLVFAVRRTAEAGSEHGGSIAQFFMTVKSVLRESEREADPRYERLFFSVEVGAARIRLSSWRIPKEPLAHLFTSSAHSILDD